MKKLFWKLNLSVTILFMVVSFALPAQASIDSSLSLGLHNSQVYELQQILTSVGVYNGPITGYFGNLTKSAVIAFQEKYGSEILTPNGMTQGNGFVGSYTRIKLNEFTLHIPPNPPTTGSGGGTACPTFAILCPDGSHVSPTGPNCQLPVCPTAPNTTSINTVPSNASSINNTQTTNTQPPSVSGNVPVNTIPTPPISSIPPTAGNGGGTACPTFAIRCSDGSYVSPTGPNCQLPACPIH